MKQINEEIFQGETKQCSVCHKILDISKFSKLSRSQDGLNGRCKQCVKKSVNKYLDKNRDIINERRRDQYKNNLEVREKNAESCKKYREENIDKIREYEIQYRIDHAEQRSEYNKQYYRDNIGYFQQWREDHSREYYKNNKDKIIARVKQYYQDNAEIIKKRKQVYYNTNRQYILEQSKKYRILNKEKLKLSSKKYKHKRRAIEKNAEGSHTVQELKEMLDFFDYKCAYTGELLEEKYHIDHIIALARGGTNNIDNLVPSNPGPNLSKGANPMEEWFRSKDYFSEERLQKIYEWIELQKGIKGEIYDESEHIEETAS